MTAAAVHWPDGTDVEYVVDVAGIVLDVVDEVVSTTDELVDELDVVAHDEHRTGPCGQGLGDGRPRGRVEIVGGLVEEHEVPASRDELRQCELRLFSSRERGGLLEHLRPRQSEHAQHSTELGFGQTERHRRHPAQVSHLVLLGSTPRFVSNGEWGHAMAQDEFDGFVADVENSLPRARLRFLTLQANGDAAARGVLRMLRESIDEGGAPAGNAPAFGLALLRDIDLRADLPQIYQPALVMHGVNDALVPHAAGEYLAAALPRAEFGSMGGAGHALFVTREAAVAQRIREFDGRH